MYRKTEPRSIRTTVFVFVVSMLLSAMAKAETSFHNDEPGSKVTAAEAAKRMNKGEVTYRCRRVKMGQGINPVSYPNSTYTWHTAVGDGIDNAAEQLAENKKVIRCERVTINAETGRVRKAQD